jgi:hypothetical protein
MFYDYGGCLGLLSRNLTLLSLSAKECGFTLAVTRSFPKRPGRTLRKALEIVI